MNDAECIQKETKVDFLGERMRMHYLYLSLHFTIHVMSDKCLSTIESSYCNKNEFKIYGS